MRTRIGAWLGALTSAVFLAVNYGVFLLLDVPMLAFVFFDWLARTLPGNLVTFGIDRLIDVVQILNLASTDRTAKFLERLMGLLFILLLGTALGAIYGKITWINTRPRGAIAALLPLSLTLILVAWADWGDETPILSIVYFTLAWAAWGAWLIHTLNRAESLGTQDSGYQTDADGRITITGSIITRRMFLSQMTTRMIGASIFIGAGGYALRGLLASNPLAGKKLANPGTALILRGSMEDNFQLAAGTRPEITPNSEFYTIDINLFSPNVEAETWQLEVKGLVQNPLTFTYEEIKAVEAVAQYATLACISNPVGGDLIGNTLWTGVRLKTILERAGVLPEANEVRFQSADGYFEVLPLLDALLDETLLCYGMNGETLQIKHGFPLRLYTPGRFGMKNPKWIETIELIRGEEKGGYWHRRGWSREAYFKMITIIDPVESKVQEGKLMVGGIAFSGDKGISKVEVRVDGGDWIEAELREPLSPLTWVQWKANVPYPDDGADHRLTARSYDSSGTPQIEREAGTRPSGATGYHQVEVNL